MTAVDDLVRAARLAGHHDVRRRRGGGRQSRQTVYNEFGSRQALVEAYVAREIETLLAEVDDAVRAHADDAHLALRTAFELFLKLASDEPVVQIIVAGRRERRADAAAHRPRPGARRRPRSRG